MDESHVFRGLRGRYSNGAWENVDSCGRMRTSADTSSKRAQPGRSKAGCPGLAPAYAGPKAGSGPAEGRGMTPMQVRRTDWITR